MSFQCSFFCHPSAQTLGSSLYYAVTWLKLSLLDPSVKHWDDIIGTLG
ncbi:hypothetical protein [Wolbachia endosymbiont (group A) of Anomoia purmunda]|nr:hypothetical protein [Wolbachia endosymbiont (group A) of Anomoia purmunda]